MCLDGANEFSAKTEVMSNLKLEHLDLSNTKLTDKGGCILIKSLERCRNLTYLNLSENELASQSGEAIYD